MSSQPGYSNSDWNPSEVLPRLASVVIPVRDGAGVIAEQLRALGDQRYSGAWEVVVADNGSADGTRAAVAQASSWVPRLRVVDASRRAGPSHARNVGAAAANGDVLLFVDADDVVCPGWLQALASAIVSADLVLSVDLARTGGLASRAVLPAGELPWGRGGNIGVRTEVFRALGGWDEHRAVGEDVEFCWRAHVAGYQLTTVPEANVYYRKPPSLWSLARQRYGFGKAAPGLYAEFAQSSASRGRLVRRSVWILTRVPYVLASRELRARWIAVAAGVTGHFHGALLLRADRARAGWPRATAVTRYGRGEE